MCCTSWNAHPVLINQQPAFSERTYSAIVHALLGLCVGTIMSSWVYRYRWVGGWMHICGEWDHIYIHAFTLFLSRVEGDGSAAGILMK